MFLLSQTEIGRLSTLQVGHWESSLCEVRNKRSWYWAEDLSVPKEADPNSWRRLTHQSHSHKSTSFHQGRHAGSRLGWWRTVPLLCKLRLYFICMDTQQSTLRKNTGQEGRQILSTLSRILGLCLVQRERNGVRWWVLWPVKEPGHPLTSPVQASEPRAPDSNHWHLHQLPTGQSPLKAKPLSETHVSRLHTRDHNYSQKACFGDPHHDVWKVVGISENCVQKLIFKFIITEISFMRNMYISFTIQSK